MWGIRLLHECMQGQGLERLDYIDPGASSNLFRANIGLVHCGSVLRLGAEVALELPICEVLDMVERFSNLFYSECNMRLSHATRAT